MADATAPDACRVSCHACEPALANLVVPHLEAAVAHLRLATHLAEAVLCVDDLPGHDTGWLRLDPGPEGRRVLTIYCNSDGLRPEPTGSVDDGARQVWEQRPAPREDEVQPAENFAPATADAFCHHQCALAADLLQHELVPDLVPVPWAEAFAAAWDVVIDGRLARSGLPCYQLAVRRARFAALFSAVGVVLPEHWQIFQSLWEGGLSTQTDVLGAVRRLPRL
ncbi:MAG: hypothetical protein GY838_09515 [bacterium]|nr:hypothetical protein [bacterium]